MFGCLFPIKSLKLTLDELQWLAVPYAYTNEHVGSLALNETDWLGHIPAYSPQWGVWFDYWMLLICGGIPWQVKTST